MVGELLNEKYYVFFFFVLLNFIFDWVKYRFIIVVFLKSFEGVVY